MCYGGCDCQRCNPPDELTPVTPAVRLRQIKRDASAMRRAINKAWAIQFDRDVDIDALARLVALAKKGAEL